MNIKPKTILTFLATSLVTCALFCQRAQAIPIDGTVGFLGSGSATTGDPNVISFVNPIAWSGTGNYSGVSLGTPVSFQSISYSGSGDSATLSASITPLWTFTINSITYSFDLTSINNASITPGSLILSGSGVARITGFDATEGSFAIQGTGSNFTFQFVSGSTTANGTTVPDGGSTVALLGFAFVGAEAFRRKVFSRESKN